MTTEKIATIRDASRALRAVAVAVTDGDLDALEAIRKQVHFHCPVAGRDELENLIAVIRKALPTPTAPPTITTEANRETHEELRELVAKSDWKTYTAKYPKMKEHKARWLAAEFYEGTSAYGRELFASVSKLRKLIMELGDTA
jgi:hypothetical protein